MYRQKNRFLFILLCTLLLCSSAQATILQISVQDSTNNATIPHATVFLNGENYARTNNNGQVFLNHSGLDDQLIRVSMTGYIDWEKLVAKNETSVFANLSKKSITLNVSLYDSDSLGLISGARVIIFAENMTQTKLTDVSGSATFDVNANTLYSIDITAQNYQPRNGIIDMGTENKGAQYWLLPSNRFSFVIKDKAGMAALPDAEVHIDAVLAGKTDAMGVLTIPVTRGKVYTIEIKKPGYQTLTESREISETDALYSGALSKAAVGAFIYSYDENRVPINGTDIYINGTLSGTTNQFGRSNFPNLVLGSYSVEVRKTGYVTVNRTIVITNHGEDYNFEMPFENANLTIFIQEKDQKIVPDAIIVINGYSAGFTDDHGQYSTKVRFNTLYNITAIKDTYQPSSVQKQFTQGNATASVTLIMEKSLDWGLITLIVIGAVAVLVLFAAIRLFGHRKGRHIQRRNEL
ncbi:MAG TPA: carboxypeptidase-like regulatory domain-containing protein [Methanoregula sp.]|nr:carboxypeptidase-like regulatory domain-containing protein [Methanoregula sp.]